MKKTFVVLCIAIGSIIFTVGCEDSNEGDVDGGVNCYSPCKTGSVVNGKFRGCSEEGLIQGCFGQTQCVDGWCVAANAESVDSKGAAIRMQIPDGGTGSVADDPDVLNEGQHTSPEGVCIDDCQCADHGTCIDGKCTGQCESDAECLEEGQGCYKKVCRHSCSVAADSNGIEQLCPVDTTCIIGSDGANGFCMPACGTLPDIEALNCIKSTPVNVPPFELVGEDLVHNTLFFNPDVTSATFKLINNTQCTLDFAVSKKAHSQFTDAGVQTVSKNPLHWITVFAESGSVVDNKIVIPQVPGNGAEVIISLSNLTNPEMDNWSGILEIGTNARIHAEELGPKSISLSYASGADGKWSGNMYYFGNFGTTKLREWQASGFSTDTLNEVENAFIKRWGLVRRGAISWDNFMAMVTSTLKESYNWSTIQNRCPSPNGACYPYLNPLEDNDDGLEVYSDNLKSSPIPSGLVELPISMNIQETTGNVFAGRINSIDTLHYAGSPAISMSLAFAGDTCEQVGMICRNPIVDLSADIVVGGRYPIGANNNTCSGNQNFPVGYSASEIPWLLPDFKGNTIVKQGYRYQQSCIDTKQPFETDSAFLPEGVSAASMNQSFALSNPLPDGRSIIRHLKIVDGAIFNKDLMFIIFEEKFTIEMAGLSQPADFSGYGFIMLRRTPVPVEKEDYAGSQQAENRVQPQGVLNTQCDSELLEEMGFSSGITADNVQSLSSMLIDGVQPDGDAESLDLSEIYYLCWESGQIHGGTAAVNNVKATKGEVSSRSCPFSSNVTFFHFRPEQETAVDPKDWKCNDDAEFGQKLVMVANADTIVNTPEPQIVSYVERRGTCDHVLQKWKDDRLVVADPISNCANENTRICDGTEADRRLGKTFSGGSNSSDGVAFQSIRSQTYDAFRYKKAFQSRTGKNLGFTPDACSTNMNGAVPYCYDAGKIETIQKRNDCAVHLLANYQSELGGTATDRLRNYLTESFSILCTWDGELDQQAEMCNRPAYQEDGVEALLSELVIMLGDDAYTNSFASRFDLAGTSTASFEGSKFEPNGINLSGAAGNEMYNLYQATQYYQVALDRFYSLMPAIYQSLQNEGALSFITAETVTNYLDRLIRASTQKARAWSEISKRYQTFNRADLARAVIERAYTAAYLESVLIIGVMDRIKNVVIDEDEAQINHIINQAQLRYKASMLGLSDINKNIVDDVNFFGFSPDYIPFPAIDEGDFAEGNINAYDKLRDATLAKIEFAAAKEEVAIGSTRDFDVDAASFQAELSTIQHSYENDLGELCGTFKGDDQYIYPAIKKYADKNEKLSALGNPCGYTDNGDIYEAMKEAEIAALNVTQANTRRGNKVKEISTEVQRVTAFCAAQSVYGAVLAVSGHVKVTLGGMIAASKVSKKVVENAKETVLEVTDNAKCSAGSSTDCPQGMVVAATQTSAAATADTFEWNADMTEKALEAAIMSIEREEALWEIAHACTVETINGFHTVAALTLELAEIDLEILEAGKNLELALSKWRRTRNTAKRLEVEFSEAQQNAINIAAAMNDPNTRIYKNDAIINADKAFWAAVKEAYKTTKVYEYYTSTSYAHLADLFLVRMVSAGDYNLENYLMELDQAFYEFEEEYGNPDIRLSILSLKDDIFKIPETSQIHPGISLSADERADLFTKKITDPELLDGNGYVRIPFGTRLNEVSPLTRVHKINYIEVELQGENLGDEVGRVYISQNGIGTIRPVEGEKQYYSFPERIAVIDTFFNGEKVIDADTILHSVYDNNRFLDRPYANSGWELVFNGVDEAVNKDINLSDISDIRLYIYYTDFTTMP